MVVSLHGELHCDNKEILYIIQWWFHCMANYENISSQLIEGKQIIKIVLCVFVDIDECGLQPCENGGTCIDHPGWAECLCKNGFTGKICQTGMTLCTFIYTLLYRSSILLKKDKTTIKTTVLLFIILHLAYRTLHQYHKYC